MSATYAVEVSSEGRADVRLSVSGEVDIASAPQMLDAILCAAFTYDKGQVVVDLGGVTFMDSTGLGALREAHRHLVADGTRLSVRNPPPLLQKVLRVTGLDTYLNIESDGDDGRVTATRPVLRRVG